MPEAPAPPSPEKDPRVYFAAERTLLAWIRTGVALMGFGFAIARFGLFLREMESSATHTSVPSQAGSPFTGVFLIALGVFINLIGSIQYAHTVRLLNKGQWMPGRVSLVGVGLGILLAVLGAIMAYYVLRLN